MTRLAMPHRRSLDRHRAMAIGHRGAKAQPAISLRNDGTMPGISGSRCRRAAGTMRYRGQQPARIRMRRMVEQLQHRRLLHGAAGIHHDHALAGLRHHAEVVGDQQDRRADPLLQLQHQPQDLRLDRNVERRGRLVGDQQLRASRPAPSRSSRAGACRRRTGADSRGPAARHPEYAPAAASRAPAPAPPRVQQSRWMRTASAICAPIGVHRVQAGHRLLEDHGDAVAADVAHLRFGQRQQFLPSKRTEPETTRPLRGSSRITDSAVTLLPQPDSPTRPSVSPGAMVEARRRPPPGARRPR